MRDTLPKNHVNFFRKIDRRYDTCVFEILPVVNENQYVPHYSLKVMFGKIDKEEKEFIERKKHSVSIYTNSKKRAIKKIRNLLVTGGLEHITKILEVKELREQGINLSQ